MDDLLALLLAIGFTAGVVALAFSFHWLAGLFVLALFLS